MTKFKYLEDTYTFESEATIIEIKDHEKGTAVVLDETIFYPQGGGQPADRGTISSSNTVFNVNDVRLDVDGTVLHFGCFENGEFKAGDKVNLKIDKDYRITNAKLHSAGHLIDCAVTQMKVEGLKPIKGFHFSDGPYVEYEGVLENPAELMPKLQKIVDELIKQDLAVETEDLSPDEAKERNVWAPPGKPARVVGFTGFPTHGCGGTHVNISSEIGKIEIRKIKTKQGQTRIAYSVV